MWSWRETLKLGKAAEQQTSLLWRRKRRLLRSGVVGMKRASTAVVWVRRRRNGVVRNEAGRWMMLCIWSGCNALSCNPRNWPGYNKTCCNQARKSDLITHSRQVEFCRRGSVFASRFMYRMCVVGHIKQTPTKVPKNSNVMTWRAYYFSLNVTVLSFWFLL